MTADLYTVVVASGTVLGDTGSHAVSLNLLCGLSGTTAIPVRVLSDGTLATSGA